MLYTDPPLLSLSLSLILPLSLSLLFFLTLSLIPSLPPPLISLSLLPTE